MTNTTIVVPCYNEADRLPVEEFAQFATQVADIGFLFVDDGSSDGTHEVVAQLAADLRSQGDALSLPENQGKAEAVRLGVLRALESNPEYVGFLDADLATPLDALPQLRQILTDDPVVLAVFGSRIRMLGRDVERQPARHYAGRAFATVVSLMLSVPIYDSQCGAKLFRAAPPIPQVFSEPFVSRWIFDVEILARLRQELGPEQWASAGEVIREFPLQTWRDVSGSKIGTGDFIQSFGDLAKIYQRYMAD